MWAAPWILQLCLSPLCSSPFSSHYVGIPFSSSVSYPPSSGPLHMPPPPSAMFVLIPFAWLTCSDPSDFSFNITSSESLSGHPRCGRQKPVRDARLQYFPHLWWHDYLFKVLSPPLEYWLEGRDPLSFAHHRMPSIQLLAWHIQGTQ